MTRTATLPFADLVMTLGSHKFESTLMSTLESLFHADLYSAFVMNTPNSMRYLLSSGGNTTSDETASAVSHVYARQFWRRDRSVQDALATDRELGPKVFRLPCISIADPKYRWLHERYGIVDRVSVYRFGEDATVILNLYRSKRTGAFDPRSLRAINAAADALSALVTKHSECAAAPQWLSRHPPLASMARHWLDAGFKLSLREAEVCAMIVTGHSAKEVARATGLKISSVDTYRKRAYRKLAVADRCGLSRMYDSLTGSPGFAHRSSFSVSYCSASIRTQ